MWGLECCAVCCVWGWRSWLWHPGCVSAVMSLWLAAVRVCSLAPVGKDSAHQSTDMLRLGLRVYMRMERYEAVWLGLVCVSLAGLGWVRGAGVNDASQGVMVMGSCKMNSFSTGP